VPIHDWTRARANRVHHFHQTWTPLIASSLNRGILPDGYLALTEQITGGPEPHVAALSLPVKPGERSPGGTTVEEKPLKTRPSTQAKAAIYARKANRITIRHPDGAVVAVIEIVSPGNKDSKHAARSFARKAAEFLFGGIHLLIVDLFLRRSATRRVSTS
jgi:hypothetical protein